MDLVIEKILNSVEKPYRYSGAELCLPVIDDQTRIRVCLCMPSLYEDAMKKVNDMVVYYMLNDRKGYSCERCFAPWLDMARQLKNEKYPLFSLETKTPLKKFDLLNFSFDYTYSYTTFLYMLDLAQIPYKSADRDAQYPLIYGSGVCMANPEPLAEFLDFAIIGDQEDVTIKVIDCLVKCKLSKFNKNQTLEALSQIEGVYVPSKMKFLYGKDGKISAIEGNVIHRQIIRDLDRAYYPTKLIVPSESTICETGVLECSRGCTQGCRFCQEGFLNRPYRERRVQTLVSQANAQVYNSGFNTVSLGSLSNDGYSKTSELIKSLNKLCEDKNVKVLMTSFRADHFNVNQTNFKEQSLFNLSIEAGTERLRKVINKNLSDSEIDQMLINAYAAGFDSVKLNFMIGLPYENLQDLLGIVETVKRAVLLYEKNHTATKPLSLFVNISIFVPKPFTPLQWCAFVNKEELKKRVKFLSLSLDQLGVKYHFYSPEISEVECILSRGDRKLAKALLYAYLKGSIFDNNSLLFDFKIYDEAFDTLNIDKNIYLAKKEINEILPWDKIDIGIDKSYFVSQYKMAAKGQVVNDCKHGCNGCGLFKKGICTKGSNNSLK
ncbi:MAG: TIGR03960 family B12-binding radical SAM protein [Clostridia bacterium]|nr:TIGR03960 family B12-binding radical SAM protein [Clostridia bacterium]